MKNREEQIWNYISGDCSAEEKQELERLMIEKPEYQLLFQEINATHLAFMQLELDEPSMGFQRNVMEQITLEPIPGRFPMVDKRIVRGIAGFFALSICSVLAYAFYLTNWNDTTVALKMPDVNWRVYFNKPVLYAFLFLDMILGLYFLDYILRKKWN